MKKALYMAIIVVIIIAIIFTALMLVLKYDEKGEKNMPFEISKITIISTADAEDIKDSKNLWNKSIDQNNDIYIYIEKNKNYKKTETIDRIEINNFKITKAPTKGNITMYKPSNSKNAIFEDKDELKTEKIIFTGDQKTEIKDLKISNQGGVIAFRIANQGVGSFTSNDKKIDYKDLLKKINSSYEELNAKVSFDLNIVLNKGKQFKSTIELEIPEEKVIEEGTSSKEITDLNLVFKRIEN